MGAKNERAGIAGSWRYWVILYRRNFEEIKGCNTYRQARKIARGNHSKVFYGEWIEETGQPSKQYVWLETWSIGKAKCALARIEKEF